MPKAKKKAKIYRLELRTDKHLIRCVDEWRRLQDKIPSRSEAIRTLVLRSIDKEMEDIFGA